MTNNPILIIAVLLLLKNRSGLTSTLPHTLNSLQLESLIDNVHSAIHMMEKMNQLGHMDIATMLPDMKKMLEVVEKIPL